MKYIKEYIAPFVIVLFSLVMLCIFKSTPVSKLWKGYSVLYIPVEADWNMALEILRGAGCDEVITIDNQYVPIEISEKTPEVSLSFLSIEKSDYLEKRNRYFFDKSHRYIICYVPDAQTQDAEKAVLEMNKNGISSGMNGKAAFPFVVPLASLAFAVVLVCFSRKKTLSALLLFFPVLFSFSQVFYSSAVVSILFMYCIYLFMEIWQRKGAVQYLFRNLIVISFLAISFFTVFFNGIKCALLFFVMTAGIVSLFFLVSNIEKFFNSKKMFVPIKIIPARMVSLSTGKSNRALLLCSLLALTVLFTSLFTSSVSNSSLTSSIVVPGPAYSTEGFPTVDDYIDWRWETMTFPYISLNDSRTNQRMRKGSKVVFTEYENSTGAIVPIERSLEYNSSFVSGALAAIDKLDYPALEKFLKVQNNVSTGYVSSGNVNMSLSTILFLLLTIFVSLFFYFVHRRFGEPTIVRRKG